MKNTTSIPNPLFTEINSEWFDTFLVWNVSRKVVLHAETVYYFVVIEGDERYQNTLNKFFICKQWNSKCSLLLLQDFFRNLHILHV